MTISFEVPGTPVPQSRPRFTRQGHAYDTDKSRNYKALVRAEAVRKMGGREPAAGAVIARLAFYLPIPKSWSKKKRVMALRGEISPTGRPDTDNLVKSVTDAVNGVVYADDSQIINIIANKCYDLEPGMIAEFVCL